MFTLSLNIQLICTLKKLCNHPCLVDEEMEGTKSVNVSDSSKLLVTSSLITKQANLGNKTVLVSNYTQVSTTLLFIYVELKLLSKTILKLRHYC